MKKSTKVLISSLLLGTAIFGTTTVPTSEVNAASGIYSSCTAFNKSYSKGVRKSASTKNKIVKKSGKVVYETSRATVSPKVYSAAMKANPQLDRDKDGIACEK